MQRLVILIASAISITVFQSCLLALGGVALASDSQFNTVADVKYTPQEMEVLESTVTYFVLRDQDRDRRSEYEEAIREVWEITPLEFVFFDDLDNTPSDGATFFMLDVPAHGQDIDQPHFSGPLPYLQLSLVLPSWIDKSNGDFREGSKVFASISLILESPISWNYDDYNRYLESYRSLYASEVIINWSPQLLKTFIKAINDDFKSKDGNSNGYRDLKVEEFRDDLALKPIYILESYFDNPYLNANRIRRERASKLYRDNFELVSLEELDRLMTSDEEVFFLDLGMFKRSIYYQRVLSSERGIAYSRINTSSMLKPVAMSKIR
ncbi:MAG: hypothetical protein AAGF87_00065 [Bacteroidota bacterium]